MSDCIDAEDDHCPCYWGDEQAVSADDRNRYGICCHCTATNEEILMAEDDQPHDLLTLAESAVAMHEMFLSFMAGGFTERQALVLIAEMLRPRDEDKS